MWVEVEVRVRIRVRLCVILSALLCATDEKPIRRIHRFILQPIFQPCQNCLEPLLPPMIPYFSNKPG